ncbi:hypothetical protein ACFWE3_07545 [Mycobacteriaceae bacterium NPDC060252]
MTRAVPDSVANWRLVPVSNYCSRVSVAALVPTFLLLSSCAQAQADEIEGVVRAFSSALDENDYSTARTLACGKMTSDLSRPDEELKAGREVMGLMGGVQSKLTTVTAPRIQGDRAHVQISVKYTSQLSGDNNVTRDYELDMRKEDSEWKICSYMLAAQ